MKATHIILFVLAVGVSAGFTVAVRGANLTADTPVAPDGVEPEAPDPHAGHDLSAMEPEEPADPHAGHDLSAMEPPKTKPAPKEPEKKPEIAIRPEKKGDVIDLNNERCPIMGGKAAADVYIDYEGLRVHFCCPGCDKTFLEKPAEGLAKMGITDIDAFKREHGGKK